MCQVQWLYRYHVLLSYSIPTEITSREATRNRWITQEIIISSKRVGILNSLWNNTKLMVKQKLILANK
jgi:hypothetical protein